VMKSQAASQGKVPPGAAHGCNFSLDTLFSFLYSEEIWSRQSPSTYR
jgi:hypothetical protein